MTEYTQCDVSLKPVTVRVHVHIRVLRYPRPWKRHQIGVVPRALSRRSKYVSIRRQVHVFKAMRKG